MKTGKSTICGQSWPFGTWKRRNYIRKIRVTMIVRDRQKVIWEEWMAEKTKQLNEIYYSTIVSAETKPFFFLLRVWCSQFWLVFLGYFLKKMSIAILGCFFTSCLKEIKYLPCTCAKERMLPQYFPYIMTCRVFSDNICERGMYSTQEN